MKKAQREAITEAWQIIDRAVDHSLSSDARSLWSELNKATLEHEKGHRAMGRRFTEGRAGYKEPVSLTAKYFAVRAVMEPHATKGFSDLVAGTRSYRTTGEGYKPEVTPEMIYRAILIDLACVREDILKGAMLHACLMNDAPKNKIVAEWMASLFELETSIKSIDYATDVAA